MSASRKQDYTELGGILSVYLFANVFGLLGLICSFLLNFSSGDYIGLIFNLIDSVFLVLTIYFIFKADSRIRILQWVLTLTSTLCRLAIIAISFYVDLSLGYSFIGGLFSFLLARAVVHIYFYRSKRVAVYFSIPGPLLDAYNAQTAQQECLEEADKKLYPHGHPASDIPAPSSAASPIRSAPAPRPSVSAAPHAPAASTAAAQAASSSAVSAPAKASPSRVRPSLSAERRAFLKGIACTLLILALLVGGYFGVQAYRAYLRSIYDEGFIDGLKTGYNQGHAGGLSETSDDMQERLDYRYRQGYKNGYNDCGNNWRYNSTPPF